MLQIPYDRIVAIILEQTSLSKEEVDVLVQEKLDSFSGLISKEGAAHIVANDQGINLHEQKNEPVQIKDLIVGMKDVQLTAKVMKKYDLVTFKKDDGEGKVQSMLVGDETGVCRLTFWHGETEKVYEFDEDTVYTFKKLQARDNRGRTELSFGASSEFEKVDKKIEVSNKQPQQAPEKKIVDLEPGENAAITGVIVQAYKPNFYIADKETNKRVHDEFDESKHMHAVVFNIMVDDGTDVIRAVCFRDVALSVMDKKIEEVLPIKDNELLFDDIKNNLLGLYIKAIGRCTKNEMYVRKEFLMNSIEVWPKPE